MSGSKEWDLFEDVRTRVIYYSCLVEPKNILEITKLWDYKTSTYFYQKQSKRIIREMEVNKLISQIEGARFKSNYDLLLDSKQIRDFFNKTNQSISNKVIIREYKYEVTEIQLEDELFKEFCLEKKPKIKEMLNEIEIKREEISKFVDLWKTDLFRNILLSAQNIKKLIKNRHRLPDNPHELLFSISIDFCEKFFYFKKEENIYVDFPNPYLFLNIEEILPATINQFESMSSQMPADVKIFSNKFLDLYKILAPKFDFFKETIDVSDIQFERLVNIIENQN